MSLKKTLIKMNLRLPFSLLLLIFVIIISFPDYLCADDNADAHQRIDKISFKGNDFFSNSRIRSLMDTKEKGLISRILFWKKNPIFSAGELEADISRIKQTYQREGFLHIDITHEVIVTDESKGKVQVKLFVDEGLRVVINNVTYQIITDDDTDHQYHIQKIKEKASLVERDNFIDSKLHSDLSEINNYYDLVGFPYVTSDYKVILSEDEELADIVISINPGQKAYIGDISFEGLQRTDSRLLHRLIAFDEGDLYDPVKLERTKNNLQSLDLFRFISVNVSLESQTSEIPAEIYIRERDNITMSVGVGYGIEDKVRVYTEITKLRFLGGLRTGKLYLKHSSLEPINVDLKVTQPVFPTVKSSLVLNPFYRREVEPAYSVERLGINTTLNHRLTLNTGAFITYSFEDNQLLSVTSAIDDTTYLPGENPEQKFYRKSSVSLGFIRDNSIPIFFPRRGNLISTVVTFSGLGFNSDYHYIRNISDFRHYQAISSSLVIATRIKGGIIQSLQENPFIPYEDRFYAGGAFSVRGWQRAMLGPKNISGDPIGGNSYLEGSIEVRYPLWGHLSAVNFLDYGNVWQNEYAHRIDELHYAAGIGFRYATMIGPIRLDFATPVFKDPARLQFFISVGQSF